MIIIPAIDILGGSCVRLVRGDYGTAGKVADDPFAALGRFEAAGAEYIHIVDLDGAKAGSPVNAALITALVRRARVPVEVGGGIRTEKDVDSYISGGVSRVILGSAAVSDRAMLTSAVEKHGARIAVGIDADRRTVRVSGWTDDSDIDFAAFAAECGSIGVKNVIFTDISKDGTLAGPNMEQISELASVYRGDVTASGGIKDINDIKALVDLGVYAAICGKSLYSGTLCLEEAIAACRA